MFRRECATPRIESSSSSSRMMGNFVAGPSSSATSSSESSSSSSFPSSKKQQKQQQQRQSVFLLVTVVSSFAAFAFAAVAAAMYGKLVECRGESSSADDAVDADDWVMEQFIFLSLMDTLPKVSPPSSGLRMDEIAIYPAAHTDDNVPSTVDGVREVLSIMRGVQGDDTTTTTTAQVPKILLHDVNCTKLEPPIPNFSGTGYMYNLMVQQRGIGKDDIEYVPGDWHEEYTGMNTLNELERLIRYCRSINIKALVIVSTPFHIPRSFLTGISVASKLYPELLVYAKASQPSAAQQQQQEEVVGYWNKIVPHSQGTLIGSRKEFIVSEMERIKKYIQAGDLIPVKQALAALNKRDIIAYSKQ